MTDLTIIFLTVNRVPEKWVKFQKEVLLEAIGDTPVITISKKPLDWGTNLIQEEEPSMQNIYRQILRGAKLATTPYIAIAEDDCLYQREHFEFRPSLDTYAYDYHRWGLMTWPVSDRQSFYYNDRFSNSTLIAPRELTISSLEERFLKYPNNRIGELGREIGTILDRKDVIRYCPKSSNVFLSHVNAIDPYEQKMKKRRGFVRAYEIPHWGRPEDILKHFI